MHLNTYIYIYIYLYIYIYVFRCIHTYIYIGISTLYTVYIYPEKELTENENFHLFAANRKKKFVFLGRQTINGNRRLLFQQTRPLCMKAWTCSKNMKHRYASRTCGIDMDMHHGHLYSMEMPSGHEGWICNMDLPQGHAA
jgi:hypothetical protein